ncbi:hypothetical protein Moror_13766 [Moniliophthora roreri MCA 2997]|uniref:Uncharacterized protein n=1 Tax=Moniliophthora roreri (strain MCA 2997) TaxID=1381753 RepID=V2X9B4_MONRO|nr:hypothetical protein Moror_13766 [Moniliophthora roreri MCA 2997]
MERPSTATARPGRAPLGPRVRKMNSTPVLGVGSSNEDNNRDPSLSYRDTVRLSSASHHSAGSRDSTLSQSSSRDSAQSFHSPNDDSYTAQQQALPGISENPPSPILSAEQGVEDTNIDTTDTTIDTTTEETPRAPDSQPPATSAPEEPSLPVSSTAATLPETPSPSVTPDEGFPEMIRRRTSSQALPTSPNASDDEDESLHFRPFLPTRQTPQPGSTLPLLPHSRPTSTSSLHPLSASALPSPTRPGTSHSSNSSGMTRIPKQQTLTPPPKIKFDKSDVRWKGLPLEAALWTLSSSDLQTVVSRAIRSSAQESFIRLLSLDLLDDALPNDLDRLRTLRTMTQAKYIFGVQRRTMLLQGLLSAASEGGSGDNASELVQQLADTTADLDRITEELVRQGDEIAQIEKLIDIHWGSALAIALRKLNGSYARRTQDLVSARARIGELEAEREDAWREAERLARKLDEVERAQEEARLEKETTPRRPVSKIRSKRYSQISRDKVQGQPDKAEEDGKDDTSIDSDDSISELGDEEEILIQTAEVVSIPSIPRSPPPNILNIPRGFSPPLVSRPDMLTNSSSPTIPTIPLPTQPAGQTYPPKRSEPPPNLLSVATQAAGPATTRPNSGSYTSPTRTLPPQLPVPSRPPPEAPQSVHGHEEDYPEEGSSVTGSSQASGSEKAANDQIEQQNGHKSPVYSPTFGPPPSSQPQTPISPIDNSDTRSTKSGKSNVATVQAARKRSLRTSMGSLRLKVSAGKRSNASSPVEPVPALPKELSSASTASTPQTPRKRTSITDIRLHSSSVDGVRPGSVVMDDLFLPDTGIGKSNALDRIEEVPRTPRHRKSVDEISLVANTRRRLGENPPGQSIPSFWMNVEGGGLSRSASTSRQLSRPGIANGRLNVPRLSFSNSSPSFSHNTAAHHGNSYPGLGFNKNSPEPKSPMRATSSGGLMHLPPHATPLGKLKMGLKRYSLMGRSASSGT